MIRLNINPDLHKQFSIKDVILSDILYFFQEMTIIEIYSSANSYNEVQRISHWHKPQNLKTSYNNDLLTRLLGPY